MITIDAERAYRFVKHNGSQELIALAGFAVGKSGADEVLSALRAFQSEDGGWRQLDKDAMVNFSLISHTWLGLQWLNRLRPAGTEMLDKTLAFLRRTQHEEGYWDEPDEIRDFNPSPWMEPGRHDNQLWLTSAICNKIKLLGREGDVGFEAALDFLRQGWEGERYPTYDHTHWMAMSLFYLQDSGRDIDQEIVVGCRDYLYPRCAKGEIDPLDIIAVAHSSRLCGSFAENLYEECMGQFMTHQQSDGGWSTTYGELHRPAATVDALMYLKYIGEL